MIGDGTTTTHSGPRPSTDDAPAPAPEPDADPEQLSRLDTWDDPVEDQQLDNPEDAELSDEDYYRDLRRDVERLRSGIGCSITDAMPVLPKDRPHSKRWVARDRYGYRRY